MACRSCNNSGTGRSWVGWMKLRNDLAICVAIYSDFATRDQLRIVPRKRARHRLTFQKFEIFLFARRVAGDCLRLGFVHAQTRRRISVYAFPRSEL